MEAFIKNADYLLAVAYLESLFITQSKWVG